VNDERIPKKVFNISLEGKCPIERSRCHVEGRQTMGRN
jgi:hypothetical protein